MQATLVLTALGMGLLGGPHCVAMCGAACLGASTLHAASKPAMGNFLFQLGRVVGYSAMGGFAAASMQGLGWLTVHMAALRPVWSMLHVAAIVLGLVLLVQGRQPRWLDAIAHSVWQRLRRHLGRAGQGAPLLLGALWAFMPCGLLYSALLVAALANSVWAGAGAMGAFAVGTSLAMGLWPWFWQSVRRWGGFAAAGNRSGVWGIRLAGAGLACLSAWALWMGLVHAQAPWCLVPSA
ncbi:sulfite exporter TauE/SafE family protein [Curvibacter sp. CHRR-16]|uniref:sulfite exporter TauE/SafE family protein n=1 Tax=Curvibacter sp. CHRR-16 TaxID=2835872 RepID=UPI001BDACEB5|nr:sulfite exporter TauE/SafE family protein [Curvibacter sp. CHRR-16]MBT0570662.1 sulfite exporter TauE/SafE family protein [Curvibacter sp. CHRR-16]